MPTPTYTDKTLSNLVISKISQAKFEELKTAGLLNEDELYLVENETLDAMGNVVKNVGTPVQNTDAANKAYVDAAVAGAGGGAVGYTVTFANDFEMINHGAGGDYYPASAPFYMVKTDGTTTTVDLMNYSSLRGTSYSDVVCVYAGNWIHSDCGFWAMRSFYPQSIYSQSISPYVRGVIMQSNGIQSGIMAFVSHSEIEDQSADMLKVPPWDRGCLSPVSLMMLTGNTTITAAHSNIPCLLKGTLIRLANGQDKPIEEITYDDELLVWDFDNGKFSSAKPLWIKKEQKANYYFKNILASGKELLTTGQSSTGWGHRMFDMDKGKFRYTTETVSDRIFTLDGIDLHKSCERIEAECEHYNIITEKHFNLFANGILTSCSLNNLYPVKDMKFVKDNREHRLFEAYDVPAELYKGLRLDEQSGDVEELNKYVNNLVKTAVERNS